MRAAGATPDQSGGEQTGEPAAGRAAGSAELYRACRSADPSGREAGYTTLWGYLYRVALLLARDQRDAEALAKDCAQEALIEVHQRLAECREPAAFRAWARRIASHKVIDELRRRRRLARRDEPDAGAEAAQDTASHRVAAADLPSPEAEVLEAAGVAELRRLIEQAPISDRSRRAVLGRFLDDVPDEALARHESGLTGRPVLPSHVQVTRSKDIARLRSYVPLRTHLGIAR